MPEFSGIPFEPIDKLNCCQTNYCEPIMVLMDAPHTGHILKSTPVSFHMNFEMFKIKTCLRVRLYL